MGGKEQVTLFEEFARALQFVTNTVKVLFGFEAEWHNYNTRQNTFYEFCFSRCTRNRSALP